MKRKSTLLCLALQLVFPLVADEVCVTTDGGECFVFEAKKESTFREVANQVQDFNAGASTKVIVEMRLDESASLLSDPQLKHHGGYLGHPRDYFAPLTPDERSNIHYLVTHLATKSLVTIAVNRSSLEQAGEQIEHVHPLKFLETVFADEELKVGIRNIRGRGWIWSDFIGGIKESLTTESLHQNMSDEHIAAFSSAIGIQSSVIIPLIKAMAWDEFIDTLITIVPRKGNHDRYDS